ncbi:hypothetical protein D3C73_1322100 [compost metagenome]
MRYVGNKHVDDCYEVVKRMIEQREAIPGEMPPSALSTSDKDEATLHLHDSPEDMEENNAKNSAVTGKANQD